MDDKTKEVLIELIEILLNSDTDEEHGHVHDTFDRCDESSFRELLDNIREL